MAFGVRQHQLPESTEKFTPECKINDVNIDLSSGNPFGAVGNAVLSLSGKLAANYKKDPPPRIIYRALRGNY
jgi:hypothetical protein